MKSSDRDMLIPPFRYGIVEHGIYRGAYPTLKNFRFLRRLRLKTILSLTPEVVNRDLASFMKSERITSIHHQVHKFQDNVMISEELMATLVSVMIDVDNYPLFVHCLDGCNNTGMLIMCLRKLQNWNPIINTAQFCWYNREASILHIESQFLRRFEETIILPEKLPSWLWRGQRISKHPTMKIFDHYNSNSVIPIVASTPRITPSPVNMFRKNSSDKELELFTKDISYTRAFLNESELYYDILVVDVIEKSNRKPLTSANLIDTLTLD